MKSSLLVLTLFAAIQFAYSQSPVWVEAHTTKYGSYVPGHYRTTPNNTRNDNYSTRPNVNPFTGETGTKPRDEDLLYQNLNRNTSNTYIPATSAMPSLPAYQSFTPTQTYSAPSLPQPVYVGPRGGVYTISPNGRKVYQ